ncbi:MAG: hypothetical protein VXX21_04315, partial [Pseudomonadota bacterium]|nr:hypothetical protein [Pseudomonadota bacterium]
GRFISIKVSKSNSRSEKFFGDFGSTSFSYFFGIKQSGCESTGARAKLSENHKLFENPQIICAKRGEFYKARAGYVELLKDLKFHLLELLSQHYQTSAEDLPL